ncbi:MAG TPA: serine/threonine protein kinase, partial [Acidimicrobiia bacterium]|nr:serine/threonine protein kinase [Acidimicrobiia bacterium]
MPPPLPDRYRLEQRLGRDGDVEGWLATDTSLDRPVLIRVLGPETTLQRREQFVTSLQGASAVSHTHLANVYSAALIEGGAFSVT